MTDPFNPFSNQDTYNPDTNKPRYQEEKKKPTVQTDIIEDYEPFNNQPAILQTETRPQTNSKVTLENLEKMQRDLEERSRRLAEEEERIRTSQTRTEYRGQMNNFPPFPQCCPIKPCFYQAIDVEIPEQYRFIVRFAFYLWLAYTITLFINIFGAMSYMIVMELKNDSGPMFGVSILYFLLFSPLAYVLWFRSIYKAFKSNSSFNFFLFFIAFAVQIIILIIQVLGINVLGSCGWIIAITIDKKYRGVMIFMIIIAISFTCELACCFYIIIKVNLFFRTSGGSLQKAKEEFGNEAAQSSTVRSAVITGFSGN